MEHWIAKHNRYSTHNAQIALRGEVDGGIAPRFFGSQAERKRWIKTYLWPRLPGRSLIFFFYLYFFRLGFLDGARGLVFCIMHGIFQEFTVVKLWEARQQRATAGSSAGVPERKTTAGGESPSEVSQPSNSSR